MSIYLDNAAAAPCDAEMSALFQKFAAEFPGNQESAGWHGRAAAERIRQDSAELCAAFGLSGYGTVSCTSGTEAVSIAAESICREAHGKEIVTTTLEHPALEKALERACLKYDLKLIRCPADRNGVCMDKLASQLSDRTAAVAVHHVQSETGGILDLRQLRRRMDQYAPKALLLCDTMQSIGKIPLDTREIRPDLFTLSGQKIGAPGGAILFCAEKHLRTARSLRSAEHFGGRCPVPVLLTLLRAGIRAAQTQEDNYAHALELRRHLLEGLRKNGLDFPCTLPEEKVSPFIIHLLTVPYQGAILTRALHQYEISTAPGSACESETPTGSRALAAMGYSKKEAFCGLRISLWKQNTLEEMDLLAEKLAGCIKNY